MNKQPASASQRFDLRRVMAIGWLLVGVVVGGSALWFLQSRGWIGPQAAQRKQEHEEGEEHGHEEEAAGTVSLPKEKWEVAGLKVQPARQGELTSISWFTGKLVLNQDRLAHVYSLVEGRVHSVGVDFGDDVEQGSVLAVIDSPEVGAAKLDLVRTRLQGEFARVNNEWRQQINTNTQALIKALEAGTPITQVDEMFGDKPMGENRQQLLSAYARLHKSKADYNRLSALASQNVVAGKQLITAKASLEADQATFLALQEQLKFTAWQEALVAQQELQQAEQAVAVAKSRLFILGYQESQLDAIDPEKEGEEISHYEIRVPFSGTVISKNVVLAERVGRDTEMFQVADLSMLWLQVDIYQKDLPKLKGLGKELRFRAPTAEHEHSAEVFYQGDILDPETRTLRLLARVPNPKRHLKAGMFVEVALPGESLAEAVIVPASALIEIEGRQAVFILHEGSEFQRRWVVVGERNDGLVQIRSGVKAGERVAVGGVFSLKSEMLKGKISHSH